MPSATYPLQRRAARPSRSLYFNGASGTISGNQVYDFQKNGIDGQRPGRRLRRCSSDPDLRAVAKNVVTGRGPVDYIAQNGIVISDGASATW